MELKQNQHQGGDVTGDGSKVWCCKKQYCIGAWNVRSMNQGKLEVVKHEMARVNINILGISELKWTWMGEFNSDDHYIYYCGQESLRRNGVAIIVNKRVWNAVFKYFKEIPIKDIHLVWLVYIHELGSEILQWDTYCHIGCDNNENVQ